MRLNRIFLLGLISSAALWAAGSHAQVQAQEDAGANDQQVLATVGKLAVTSNDLESAIASSPFATQFASMDEDDQAALRGDLLKRLVFSRLFRLEAKKLGLDKGEAFKKDVDDFRMGLLYRYYMDHLRARIQVPPDVLAQMKQTYKGDADSLKAAEASYRADRYKSIRLLTLQQLKKQFDVKFHEERIGPQAKPDTVLMEGKNVSIRYSDLLDPNTKQFPKPETIRARLYKRAELLLVAKVAEEEGVDVSERVKRYKEERLPAMLVEKKTAEWVPSDEVLRKYYKEHPQIGRVPERRHIGQLVVATREEAEKLRKRILAGESLFRLAGKLSIDEHGRARNGDMGWIAEGQGAPQLEAAVAKLKDGELSEVVQTPKGFHLVTVLERVGGSQKTFAAIKDRVKQIYLNEKLAQYTADLGKQYHVVWNVLKSEKDRDQ